MRFRLTLGRVHGLQVLQIYTYIYSCALQIFFHITLQITEKREGEASKKLILRSYIKSSSVKEALP